MPSSYFFYSFTFLTKSCSGGFGLYMTLNAPSNDISGIIEKEKFWIKVARTVLISIKANLLPMQV